MPLDPEEFSDSISPEELNVERFHETRKVRDFDCGNRALNDFLNTEEVERYEKEGLGRTFLVYSKGKVVAYFTTSFDSIRIEYLTHVKSFSRFAEMKIESLPAVKIGRLGVAKELHRRGIGRILIKYIIGMALELGGKMGVRLLIVQAKPESITFYEKCGFALTVAVKRERGRHNRTMFLDLHHIPDEV